MRVGFGGPSLFAPQKLHTLSILIIHFHFPPSYKIQASPKRKEKKELVPLHFCLLWSPAASLLPYCYILVFFFSLPILISCFLGWYFSFLLSDYESEKVTCDFLIENEKYYH